MRKAFIETLCCLATEDPRILLLTGDLGYMALEPFRDRFPDRFVNTGVAEQNMIGMATGLAEAGFLPFVYSIATFASCEDSSLSATGPVLHKLPVRIVGMGMGFEYGHAGSTHYAVEDVGALRTLAGLTIVVPADPAQAASAIRKTAYLPGPLYYSLGKDDRSYIANLDGRFELGRVQVVRRGKDLAILSMGSISGEAVSAAEDLSGHGIESTVAIVSSFHPDPVDDVAAILASCKHAISVEAQAVSGGLASFLAMIIAEHGLACRLSALAVRTGHDGSSGSQRNRWEKHGLSRENILTSALKLTGVIAR